MCVGEEVLGNQNWGPQHARQQLYHPLHLLPKFLIVYHYCPPGDAARLRNIIISIITKPFKTRNKKNLED